MADTKLTALTATTSPLSTDIIYIVTDPSGVPASKKVTLGNAIKASGNQAFQTLTDAATIATDCSTGLNFKVTLGGNRTLGNPTNAVDGQRYVWMLIQDATGSRTLTLDTKFSLGSDISSILLTTTASKRDFITTLYSSSDDKFYIIGFIRGF